MKKLEEARCESPFNTYHETLDKEVPQPFWVDVLLKKMGITVVPTSYAVLKMKWDNIAQWTLR